MAFVNHGGESVIDVFAQVCDEVISSTLEQFQEVASGADDPAKKKEYRIKMRAIEAYREELKSRFLQHVCLGQMRIRTIQSDANEEFLGYSLEPLAFIAETSSTRAEREDGFARRDYAYQSRARAGCSSHGCY
jgi:hypothetical protein